MFVKIIYGGSFNPPTIAHLAIVNKLKKKYPKAKIVILPVGNTYQKRTLIEFKHRLVMLELLFDNDDNVEISLLEKDKKYDGTLSSIKALQTDNEEIAFVVGSDQINQFDQWINYQELLKKYQIIIFKRNHDNVDNLMKKYQDLTPNYHVIEFDFPISSSDFRKNSQTYQKNLSKEVYRYIVENKLYGVENNV